jgi:hypothetical protein
MERVRWGLVAGMVLAVALAASAWYEYQERPAAAVSAIERADGGRVEEILLRPCRLPFEVDTSLNDVAAFLGKTLHAPVVIDRAALERQGLTEDSTVKLALDGVRLKTALQLLLDQLGLTYRVVAEDNLLVVTDPQGADDRVGRILAELESLHRDVHDLQDAVDGLYQDGGPGGDGPALRAPAIIEEVPEEEKPAPPKHTPTRSRPG